MLRREIIVCCKFCENSRIVTPDFYDEIELDAHISTVHLQWNPWECIYCDARASTERNLKFHIRKLHPFNAVKVLCTPDDSRTELLEYLKLNGRFPPRQEPQIHTNPFLVPKQEHQQTPVCSTPYNVPKSLTPRSAPSYNYQTEQTDQTIQTIHIKEETDTNTDISSVLFHSTPATLPKQSTTSGKRKKSVESDGPKEALDIITIDSSTSSDSPKNHSQPKRKPIPPSLPSTGNKSPATKDEQANEMQICQMCQETIEEAKLDDHIWEDHLRINIYECPISGCPLLSLKERRIIRHLKQVHSLVNLGPSDQPIDNRKKHQKQFDTFLAKCFPQKQTQESKRSHKRRNTTSAINERIQVSRCARKSHKRQRKSEHSEAPADPTGSNKSPRLSEVSNATDNLTPNQNRTTLQPTAPEPSGTPVSTHVEIPTTDVSNATSYGLRKSTRIHYQENNTSDTPDGDEEITETPKPPPKKPVDTVTEILIKEETNTETKRKTPKNAIPLPYRFQRHNCPIGECKDNFDTKHMKEHFFTHHVKNAFIRCPYEGCSRFSKRKFIDIKIHMEQDHNDNEENKEIVDDREDHSDEYEAFKLAVKQMVTESRGQVFTEIPRRTTAVEENQSQVLSPEEFSNGTQKTEDGSGSLKAFCKTCNRLIFRTNAKRHYYVYHLKKPVILCPYEGCKSFDFDSKANVQMHITRMHQDMKKREGSFREVINEKLKYEGMFQRWRKADLILTETEESTGESIVAADKKPTIHQSNDSRSKEESENESADSGGKSPTEDMAQSSNAKTVYQYLHIRSRCNECNLIFFTSEAEHHYFVRHLNKALIKCPYEGCRRTDFMKISNIKRHMRRQHRHNPKGKHAKEVIDERPLYQKQYEEWRLLHLETLSAPGQELSQPKLTESDNTDVKCILCNAVFKKTELKQHYFVHHLRQPVLQCPYKKCTHTNFGSTDSIENHIRLNHLLKQGDDTESPKPIIDKRPLYTKVYEKWHRENTTSVTKNGEDSSAEGQGDKDNSPVIDGNIGWNEAEDASTINEEAFPMNEDMEMEKNVLESPISAVDLLDGNVDSMSTAKGDGYEDKSRLNGKTNKAAIFGLKTLPATEPYPDRQVRSFRNSRKETRRSDQPPSTSTQDPETSTQYLTETPDPQSSTGLRTQESNNPEKLNFTCAVCKWKSNTAEIAGIAKFFLRRHIFTTHIRKPVVRCSYPDCTYTNTFEPNAIKKHSESAHGKDTFYEVIDERPLYQKEYQEWHEKCFDNYDFTPPSSARRKEERGSSPASRPGLCLCKICLTKVDQSRKGMHIYRYHMKEIVFECPYPPCKVKSAYSLASVKVHMRKYHRGLRIHRNVVDNRHLHMEQFLLWKDRCFPRLQKKTQSAIQEYSTMGTFETDESNLAASEMKPTNDISSTTPTFNGTTKRRTPSSRNNCYANYPWACKVCHKRIRNSSNFYAHIYIHHIKKPVMKCPYQGCDSYDYHCAANVRTHIRLIHAGNGEPLIEPIDDRYLYREEYNRFKVLCGREFSSESDDAVSDESPVSKWEPVRRGRPPPDVARLKKPMTCLECKQSFSGNARLAHIYIHHLRKPVIRCPYTDCEASDFFHVENVRIHIRLKHKGEPEPVLEPIDDKYLYGAELLDWKRRCLGDEVAKKSNSETKKLGQKDNHSDPVDNENPNNAEQPTTSTIWSKLQENLARTDESTAQDKETEDRSELEKESLVLESSSGPEETNNTNLGLQLEADTSSEYDEQENDLQKPEGDEIIDVEIVDPQSSNANAVSEDVTNRKRMIPTAESEKPESETSIQDPPNSPVVLRNRNGLLDYLRQ